MKGNKLLGRISYQGKAAVCGLTITELKIRFKNIGYAGAAIIVAVEHKPN